MHIKILGPGCKNCVNLEKEARAALSSAEATLQALLSVDAQVEKASPLAAKLAAGKAAEGLGLERRAPSMLRAVDIMSDVQLHRYNAATLEQMQDSLQRWAKDVSTPERKVQPRLVTVALRDVVDESERQRLSRISTNFDLEGGQVDALVAAGRALLRANPEFRGLLDALGGKPAN